MSEPIDSDSTYGTYDAQASTNYGVRGTRQLNNRNKNTPMRKEYYASGINDIGWWYDYDYKSPGLGLGDYTTEATQDDISQIHTIYSFYVRESVATFLRQPPPLESLISSFREIQSRGLPYRVAIDTTGKVLGYGYLAPFNGTRMAYAPTVEVSLYVHPEYTSKGVGSRLLSSILESVESEAGVWHRACEHKEYESHVQVIPEDEGRVCSIIACMAVDTTGKENGEGLRKWYEQRGFVERGRLKNVGYKQGRWIDTVYLQYSVRRDGNL
ncbi:hypothetical protein CNMCM8689_001175 [Aspergillus fumigatus]|nr:hypothetical protein CNMCM8689_001175 [Aspergillus fumigatus]KAH2462600.1 hypothetical protein KXV71_004536 [Aspergillus fumigatus]KAH2787754.1 hypothetical protein KXW38_004204 [Aspergillus fumigatus]KAJ8178997.1 hypothetical protein LV161_007837 [Aspergillus fumigatus]